MSFDSETICEIGHDPNHGFCFDNELPKHRRLLPPFEIRKDLLRCGEYLEFIQAGGYTQPRHWLSEGWGTVVREGWQQPLYWLQQDDQWMQFTLMGLRPIDPNEPVIHLSYYEADAFARWSGNRLPTETEWEYAVAQSNDLEAAQWDQTRGFDTCIHPTQWKTEASQASGLKQIYSNGWQWTCSSYDAYPGYQRPAGTIGEYNGKFMCGNYVLRGGSCATPPGHTRRTYRNFFAPSTRWQFSGLRLAR